MTEVLICYNTLATVRAGGKTVRWWMPSIVDVQFTRPCNILHCPCIHVPPYFADIAVVALLVALETKPKIYPVSLPTSHEEDL